MLNYSIEFSYLCENIYCIFTSSNVSYLIVLRLYQYKVEPYRCVADGVIYWLILMADNQINGLVF